MGAPRNETGSSAPTAGQCQVCRAWTNKRYGGEGRYLVMCLDCWLRHTDEEPTK